VLAKGAIDIATAPRLDECLLRLSGEPVVVVFSAVTFMDSNGLAVVDRQLRFHRANPNPRRIIASGCLCGKRLRRQPGEPAWKPPPRMQGHQLASPWRRAVRSVVARGGPTFWGV
jgi:hypothetical protein